MKNSNEDSALLAIYKIPLTGISIEVRKGDITDEPVGAIVNPANSMLSNGGGAAAAIARKASPFFQEACDVYTDLGNTVDTATGSFVYKTVSGETAPPFDWIISIVGPQVDFGVIPNEDDEEALRETVFTALDCADDLGVSIVSLPAISSGIFGYPKDLCAKILFDAAIDFAQEQNRSVETIRFTNFDQETCDHFLSRLSLIEYDDADLFYLNQYIDEATG